MRARTRRLASTVAIMALAAATLSLAAAPAQAHACSNGKTASVSTPSASAQVTVYQRCGDGRTHWHGTVRDTKCDAKAGRVALIANPTVVLGWQWDHGYEAPNGCGTSATFSGSDAYIGAHGTVKIVVFACNWRGCSDDARNAYLTW